MAEAVIEKAVCEKCGADVREGTTFCYSCGSPLDAPKAEETSALEVSPNGAESSGEKRSRAAEARRKARVNQRKEIEYTWEPTEDLALPLIASIVVVGVVFVVAVLLVFWK